MSACPRFQFRNQYDNDVTVWSPQGRLHQVEYAMEAVKQGSATIGLKSSTHAVVVALKRASSELSAYQKKVPTVSCLILLGSGLPSLFFIDTMVAHQEMGL